MSGLNTHQLNVFLVAAENLNFTQAAQSLQMTQPSVSQHIQALEEHFGIPLFLRSGRNIELTDAGVALIPLARELVYLAKHLEESMDSLKGGVHGHLFVGCSTSTGRYMLPKLLANFHEHYPQVRATCQVTTRVNVLEMLRDGKIHLAITSSPSSYPLFDYRKISQEKITLITHPDHPWSKKNQINPEDIACGEFILPEEGSETFIAVQEALEKAGYSIFQLPTVVSLGSLEAIALSVLEGLGVGFVPELLINRLMEGKVSQVEITGIEMGYEVFVARSTHRPATAAQEAFWEMITQLGEQSFWLDSSSELVG